MKKIKEEKGITLIALIITIVVLLILAAVAIGTAQESNIVGYAQNAAGKYEQAKDNEISLLNQYENKIQEVIQGTNEYPKVYSVGVESQKMYWIQTGEKTGVLALNTDKIYAFNTKIEECSDLSKIQAFSQATIVDNGYEYSLVALNNMNMNLVYSNNINKWILLSFTLKVNSSEIAEVRIESDKILEEDATLTQEQINAFIEAAID